MIKQAYVLQKYKKIITCILQIKMNKGKYYLPSPQIYAKKEMPLIQKCNKGGVRHRMPLKLVSAA